MDYNELTEKQKLILSYIKQTLREKGYPPSVREIGKAVGLSSTSTVFNYLSKLEKLGFIERDPAKTRAINVLEEASWRQKSLTPVPLIGHVQAGQPVFAEENVEDTYPLPSQLVGADNVFMLRVQGDSMINAGILDGDLVLVRQQVTAANGEIVVALVNDEEATVKRFYKESNRIRLQPENEYFEPIYCQDVKILGKVIGMFRLLS